MMALTDLILLVTVALIFHFGADVTIDIHGIQAPVVIHFPESQPIMWMCVIAAALLIIPKKWQDRAADFIVGFIRGKIKNDVKCPRCGGTGIAKEYYDTHPDECLDCHGTGWIKKGGPYYVH